VTALLHISEPKAAHRNRSVEARTSSTFGPWLWSGPVDLAVFGGSALVALGLVALGRMFGFGGGPLPEWGFVAFVLSVDVAHVYATLFRTYFDADELRSHPWRYFAAPVGVYAAGVALYARGPLVFWRVLAYLAVFHFVRQQAGWVAVYRARAAQRSPIDAWIDGAAVYLATFFPLVVWHAHLAETHFDWFVHGDFVAASALAAKAVPFARSAWLLALAIFFVRQVQLALTTGTLQLGKSVVVATTAAIWYLGIVATNSDFDFTVTNVLVHGVPYIVLLWAYARERRKDRPLAFGAELVARGLPAFLGALLVLAFAEELAWDRLVWKDHGWLFGSSDIELGSALLGWIVPLLALPQAFHYVLDGFLWRRGDTRRLAAQRRALGFDAP
jgi:hypothetical protein